MKPNKKRKSKKYSKSRFYKYRVKKSASALNISFEKETTSKTKLHTKIKKSDF